MLLALIGALMVFITMTREEVRLRCDGDGGRECVIEDNLLLGSERTQWLIYTNEVERFSSQDLGEALLREREPGTERMRFRVYLRVGLALRPFSIYSPDKQDLQDIGLCSSSQGGDIRWDPTPIRAEERIWKELPDRSASF